MAPCRSAILPLWRRTLTGLSVLALVAGCSAGPGLPPLSETSQLPEPKILPIDMVIAQARLGQPSAAEADLQARAAQLRQRARRLAATDLADP